MNNDSPARPIFLIMLMMACVFGIVFVMMSNGTSSMSFRDMVTWDSNITVGVVIYLLAMIWAFYRGFPDFSAKALVATGVGIIVLAASVEGWSWWVSNDSRPDTTVGWVVGIGLSLTVWFIIFRFEPPAVQGTALPKARTSTDTSGRRRKHEERGSV